MKKAKKRVFIGILILALLAGAGIGYYRSLLEPVDRKADGSIVIDIEEGSSGNKIAGILEEQGLIKDSRAFKFYLKRNKINNLKAGEYEFNRTMSVDDLVSKLQQGGKNLNVVSFTIPEGYEIKQIAKKLSDQGLVDEDLFLERTSKRENFDSKFDFLKSLEEGQSLEGYLFPSTYEIDERSGVDGIIDMMLEEFELVYQKDIAGFEDQVDLDFNEIVTLASIVERESRREDEREKISAVFHNRLKDDMRLQSCATVQYILGERKEVLSRADTRIESDFNTYLHSGLPPTPISSVGRGSLLAAVRPANVDYLYFRTKDDGSGGHTFSKTYEDHLRAKPKK